jgi:hypothetical protein
MRLLRAAGLVAVLVGAVGSVGLMLHAGRHNDSLVLLGLFTGWVLSPFVVLLAADRVSKNWSIVTRATLYSVMLALALGFLAIYGYVVLGPPRPKIAAVFLVVPPASWVVIIIAVATAALISRRGGGD